MKSLSEAIQAGKKRYQEMAFKTGNEEDHIRYAVAEYIWEEFYRSNATTMDAGEVLKFMKKVTD